MAVHRCRAGLNTVNAPAVRMAQQSDRFLASIPAKPSELDARTAASRACITSSSRAVQGSAAVHAAGALQTDQVVRRGRSGHGLPTIRELVFRGLADTLLTVGQKMTAAEVKAKIHAEIGDRWAFRNAHGVDLRRCLVEPEQREYCDYQKQKFPEKLWLVLEEDPKEKKGYSIVFGEAADMFGLAIRTDKDVDMCIGFYGSFMETLEAM